MPALAVPISPSSPNISDLNIRVVSVIQSEPAMIDRFPGLTLPVLSTTASCSP